MSERDSTDVSDAARALHELRTWVATLYWQQTDCLTKQTVATIEDALIAVDEKAMRPAMRSATTPDRGVQAPKFDSLRESFEGPQPPVDEGAKVMTWTSGPAVRGWMRSRWLSAYSSTSSAVAGCGRGVSDAVSSVRQRLCGLLGHDNLRHFEPNRICLRCSSCGHVSTGWRVSFR